ncbi:MAG: ABC transporter permease [Promethearchaeota archaeon]
MSFSRYIVRRIFTSIITILGILVITFFITRALPGDPAWLRLPQRATYEEYLAQRKRLGLDKPFFIQFIIFVKDMFTGNWGLSYTLTRDSPVWGLVMQKLPRSLEIMFISMIIAIIFGLMLGKITGANINSKKDILIRCVSYFFVSIPAFVLILFFMQLYVNTPLRIFPMFGYKTFNYEEPPTITNFPLFDSLISGNFYLFIDLLWHLIVPVSAMTLIQLVIIMRQTRASMIETMEQDFILVAQAKGCTNKYIRNKHAFKNAVPPGIIASGTGFAIILGGMVAVERLYYLPGLGWMFHDAIIYSDYNIITATVFVFSIVSIIFNLISDLLIAMLDPRVRLK